MGYNDVDRMKLAELSYIDIPEKFKRTMVENMVYIKKDQMDKVQPVSMKEIADYYLNTEEGRRALPSGDLTNESIINTLKECQNGKYKDFKIVGYQNNNNKDGMVGYAIETEPGKVTVAYRGSETPAKGEKNYFWEDWIDNVKIAMGKPTPQQEKSLEFLNTVGKYAKELELTGHSKGGNDALFAAIMADPTILEKLKNITTFNAPGFTEEFINDPKNLAVIEKLRAMGIIKEYQGEGDIVSSLMKNIGDPIIIQHYDWRGKEFIEDHFMYSLLLNGDGTDFVPSQKGKKDFWPEVLNTLTLKLLNEMSDEQVQSVVDLVEDLLSEELSVKHVVKTLLDADVTWETVKGILCSAISVIAKEFFSRIADKIRSFVATIKGYINNIKKLVVDSIKNAKDFVVSTFTNIKDSIVNLGKETIRKIAGGPIKIKPIGGIGIVSASALTNFIYTSATDKKCIVTPRVLSNSLSVYQDQYEMLGSCIKDVDNAVKELVTSGWSGHASYIFINVKFLLYKNEMNKCKKQLKTLMDYVKQASVLFTQRELDEIKLANVF